METQGRTIPQPAPEQRTHIIERLRILPNTICPAMEQTEPFPAVHVYQEFVENFDGACVKYLEKRVTVSGVVVKAGPDSFGAQSVELSDRADGRCYALIVFPKGEEYEHAALGDQVVCTGNFLNAMEPYGSVMKNSTIQILK